MAAELSQGQSWFGPGGPLDIPGLALVEVDADGFITAASGGSCELFGRPASALIGHAPSEFAPANGLADSSSPEQAFVRPDGTAVLATLRWLPLDGRGRSIGYLTDLTLLSTTRARADRDHRHYAALIEHSSDLIFVIDGDGLLSEANGATVRLIGHHLGEQAQEILTDLAHPDDLDGVLAALASAFSEPGFHPDVDLRLTDGSGGWVSLTASANNRMADPAVRGLVVTARDVTRGAQLLQQARGTTRSLLVALVRATEFRDPYTAGHELKVAALSRRIAEHLGMPASQCELVELGASVHDIGKIAIPAEILTRPGRLSALEYEMVKTHCEVGFGIIRDVALPPEIADIVLHHHERLDGSGYPEGLAGAAISLPARIVAVADVLDAMGSHRPYRPALGLQAALAEIRRGSGMLYDAAVVAAALAITSGEGDAAVADVQPVSQDPDVGVVLLDTARGLLRAESIEAAVGVLIGAVVDLGGATCSAHAAPADALPIDVSLGHADPLLVVAPAAPSQRRLLEEVLPGLVEDAKLAAARAERLSLLVGEADSDPLTGLGNRRGLSHRRPPQERDCVVMLDLDHFKAVNDTHGHEAGDRVLVAFSRALRASLRGTDTVFRLGGEEFLLVLPDTTEQEAHTALCGIRERWDVERPLAVTFSAGICDVHDDDLTTCIARADAALYRAKEAGRDRFELSSAHHPEGRPS